MNQVTDTENSTIADTSADPATPDAWASIEGTVLDIWADFLEHLPLFVGGILVLVIAAVAAARRGNYLPGRSTASTGAPHSPSARRSGRPIVADVNTNVGSAP